MDAEHAATQVLLLTHKTDTKNRRTQDIQLFLTLISWQAYSYHHYISIRHLSTLLHITTLQFAVFLNLHFLLPSSSFPDSDQSTNEAKRPLAKALLSLSSLYPKWDLWDLCCPKPQMVIKHQTAEKSKDTVSLHLSKSCWIIAVFPNFSLCPLAAFWYITKSLFDFFFFNIYFSASQLSVSLATPWMEEAYTDPAFFYFWFLGSRGMKPYDYRRPWALPSSAHTIPVCWARSPILLWFLPCLYKMIAKTMLIV